MRHDSEALSPQDLEQRFEAARCGDQDAYADVLRELLRILHAVATRQAAAQIARGQTASDYVSTAVRRVLASGGLLRFDTAADALRYLKKSVENRAVDGYRRRSADRRLLDRLKTDLAAQRPESGDEGTDPQLLEPLTDLLASLTADEQRLLTLVFEGHSWSQIGRELGVSDKTAKKRFVRLCGVLQELLEARGGTELCPGDGHSPTPPLEPSLQDP